MDIFDRHSATPGGGRAGGGGSFYHVSFRSGSRSTGASAKSAHNYIVREGEYGEGDRDPVVYTESDHMPTWAAGDPGSYWEGADLYERANGRLYVSADFALPRGLSTEDQVALAHSFARELTSEERLPYTLAIHAGQGRDGDEQNPHAHLMISERRNDGVERRPRAVVLARESRRPVARGRRQESNLPRSRLGRECPGALGRADEPNAGAGWTGRPGRPSELRTARRRPRARASLRPSRRAHGRPRPRSRPAGVGGGRGRRGGEAGLHRSRDRRAGDREELAGARCRRAPRPGRRLLGLQGLES